MIYLLARQNLIFFGFWANFWSTFGAEGGLGYNFWVHQSTPTWMRYPRMDVEPTTGRWPRSPQSKPSDLGEKHVIFYSKQIFGPPFRPQGGLGCKKKVHQSIRTYILGPTWVLQIIWRRSRRAIEDSFREIKRCIIYMVRFQENTMLARQNLIFLDSEQIFDPLSELKEVPGKKFKFTNRLRHEWGKPGWM